MQLKLIGKQKNHFFIKYIKKSSNEKTNVIRWFIYPDFKNKKWIYKGNSKVEEKLIDLTNFWNNQSFFKI